MIDIDKITYPHIKHLYNVEPNLEAFFRKAVVYSEENRWKQCGVLSR